MIKKLTLLAVAILFSAVGFSQIDISNLPNATNDTISRNDRIADSLFAGKKEVQFKFKVPSKDYLFGLTAIVSIDNYNSSTQEVTAYATKTEFSNFLNQSIAYTIVQPEVNSTKAYDMATTPNDYITTYNFARYPTYSCYDQVMTWYETNYPTLCKRYDLATIPNANARKLIALKVTSNVSTNAPKVKFLYCSSLHGDEVTGYMLTLRLIYYLLSNYGSNSEVTNILDNIEIWFIPDENPDGTYYSGNNTIAASPTSTRGNANGIDMNRNFPDFVGGPHPDGRDWQYEVGILRAFRDTSDFTMGWEYHGGGEVINYYYDTYNSAANLPTDNAWYVYIGGQYVATARAAGGGYTSVNANGYTEGGDWYWVFGGSQDYSCYYNRNKYGYVECSTTKTPQTSTTAPLLSSYWPINYQAMLDLMEQSLYGIRGYVTDATSGVPVIANVSIPNDKDHTDVYSSEDFGDYYKLLSAGSYYVTYSAPGYVSQTLYLSVTNGVATNQNVALTRATPVADFTADLTTTLDGKVVFTNTSNAMSSATWLWTFGDGQTSTEKNPTHNYTSSGTFNVRLDLYSPAGNTYVIKNSYITVNALPSAPSCATPAAQCGSGSFVMTASGGTIYNWYDAPTGGNLLYTGATYTSPTITTTTTYYVENEVKQATQNAGMAYAAGTNQNNSPGAWYLKFDALAPIRLESVVMNPSVNLNARLIEVHDDSNNLIASKVWTPSVTGQQTVTLDFYIPAGNGYKISARMNNTGAVPNLSYSISGFSFPTSYSLVNITGSFYATTAPDPTYNTYYMYFYDWKVAPASARSVRTPVTCTITKVGVSISANTGTNICSGTNVTFTATATNGGASPSYQWKLNGGNVGSNSSTYSNSALVNGDVVTCELTGNGACTAGNPAISNALSMVVTGSVPSQPSSITGIASPCQGSTLNYYVTNVSNTTYTWSAPGDWTILSGQGTNRVSYIIGSNSGSVSVTPSNGCGNGTARTLAVTPIAAPNQPSSITGSSTPCQASSQSYSVTNVAGITYTWTIPSDWSITAGQGTNSITVTVGSASGTVLVTPVNSNQCTGESRSLAVTVTPFISLASVINGPTTPLVASTQTYYVTSVSGITYTWSTPAGWSITSGQNTYSITVTVGANSGNVSVTPSSSCGSGSASSLAVTPTAAGNDRYSRATGNWNNTTTVWALTPTGAAGNYVPVAGNNVYIQSGHNITVNVASACSSIDIGSGGTLTISNGFTLTVNGDVTGVGTIVTSTSGTRTINLKGNWNYRGSFTGTYFYFTATGTGDQIIASNSNLSCRVFTLNKASGTLYIAKSPTISTTTTLTAGNVNYCGGNQTLMGATHPGNVTISGSGTKTISASRSITGNFEVASGAYFNTGPGSAFTFSVTGTTTVSGNLALSGTGAKTFTGNVILNPASVWSETGISAVNFAGNLQNDAATFRASSGTHTFSGSGKTLSGSTTISIPNLAVTGTYTNNGTVTVSGALSGAGTLTNGATGILNIDFTGAMGLTNLTANTAGNTVDYGYAGTQTLKVTTYSNLTLSGSGVKTIGASTVNGILSLEGTASASAAPTYGANATIQYKGSAAQTTGVELPATFNGSGGLIISNTSGSAVTLAAGVAEVLSGPLTINTNAKFEISKTSSLTVGGATSNAGTFTIKADASSVGSFIDNGTITGSGTFNVEKYMTGSGGTTPNGRFWYIASPVTTATSNVINAAGSDKMWYYTEGSPGAYTEITDNTTPLSIAKGYSVRLGAASGTYTFTGGTFNKGQIDITGLTRTGTTDGKRGFHLVGNPYPSHVSWDAAVKTNMGTTIWYRIINTSNSMVFDTYNSTGSIGTNNNGFGAVTGSLAPMQTVWVRASTDNVAGSITFNWGMRTPSSSVSLKTENQNNILRMLIANGSYTDEAVIYFNSSADNSFDDFDSEKMFSDDESYPQVYTTTVDSVNVAINGQAELLTGADRTVPLGYSIGNAGTFTLQATNLDDFDQANEVYLEDKLTGNVQDLRSNNTYSFSSAAMDNADRFVLHFGGITTSISSAEDGDVLIYAYGDAVYIETPVECLVTVYNVVGEKIAQKHVLSGLNKIPISDSSSKGIYIVDAQTHETKITKKVFFGN